MLEAGMMVIKVQQFHKSADNNDNISQYGQRNILSIIRIYIFQWYNTTCTNV